METFSLVLWSMLLTSAGYAFQPAVDSFKREGTKEQRAAKDKLEGKSPPPLQVFDWTNTQGQELNLPDLKGKVVVLYFWGVWSEESRAVLPRLKKLQEKHAKDGLVLVGIHTTRQGGKMADYVKTEGITWPVAIDRFGDSVKAYHVDSFPDFYLIDRQGILRVADLDDGDLEQAVTQLLKE